MSGCLVNKLTLDVKPGEDIDVNIEVKFTNVDRRLFYNCKWINPVNMQKVR